MQRLHGHLWVHSNKEIEWGTHLEHMTLPPPLIPSIYGSGVVSIGSMIVGSNKTKLKEGN